MNPVIFFLRIIGPPAPFVLVAALLLAFAGYLVAMESNGYDQTLGMALFLQLFAASSGYRDRLRRGHFDPILVGSRSSTVIAGSHWAVSVGLGALVWIALGVINLVAGVHRLPTAFTLPALIAFAYTSTVVWTVSLALGRYSGAILWLMTIFVLASTQHLQPWRASWVAPLIFPFSLLFESPPQPARIIAVVAVATIAVWILGAVLISRFLAVLVES